MQEELNTLKSLISTMALEIQDLLEWKRLREAQQLSNPVDDASKSALGAGILQGDGQTALTQSVSILSTPLSINVPKAYLGTKRVRFGNEGTYEIPYIAQS